MRHALRPSIFILAGLLCLATQGCQTHDRRIYTTRQDKNLHTPNPWAPSTTKAADDATSSLGTQGAAAHTGSVPTPAQ